MFAISVLRISERLTTNLICLLLVSIKIFEGDRRRHRVDIIRAVVRIRFCDAVLWCDELLDLVEASAFSLDIGLPPRGLTEVVRGVDRRVP